MHSPSTRAQAARIEFHRKTGKIHPRKVSGRFDSLRWAMVWITQIWFYGACWLTWDGRQALLFDTAERKFYLFGLVLWPQDALLLALLLIVSATALFLVTMLVGRVFCGFACPQTVYTAVFRWVEERIEGDHLARMRLDQSGASGRKLALKGTKHLAWLAIALWTGITFVGYFTPIRELLWNLGPGELGAWEGFWVFFYAGFTYLQAGYAREAVCLHMCPYSRFQGVMFDADTRTVSYDASRGEPRKAGTAPARGDCVDCTLCVQVCPTGIDIRDGLQYQCINCGLCVDACDEIMARVGTPTGLIRFASERELAAPRDTRRSAWAHPRAAAYAGLLAAIVALAGWVLAERIPLHVDVLRDRRALLHEAADGSIENTYTLKLANMLEAPRSFQIRVEGPNGARLVGPAVVSVAAGSVLPVLLRVASNPEPGHTGAQPIRFHVSASDDTSAKVIAASSFLLP